MHIGLGFSSHQASLQAGQEAASLALQLQQHQPELVLAYCTHALNPHDVFQGIRAEVGAQVPIIGGSAIGIIGNDCLLIDTPAVVVAALRSDTVRLHYASSNGLFKDARLTGMALGNQLATVANPECLLLMYDSIKHPASKHAPAVLNPSNLVLQGLAQSRAKLPTVVGAGLLGDHHFQSSWQFTGFDVQQQHALALLLAGQLQSHVTVMHGCTPLSDAEYRISSIHGQFLYQLDGKPAVQVIDEALSSNDWRHKAPISDFCFGRAVVDSITGEQHYINRLISGMLPEQDGLILFEDDFKTGDKVVLMKRDPQAAWQAAAKQTAELLWQIKQSGQQPLLAIYMNCGGRALASKPDELEETKEIQRLLSAAGIPLLGFYSGVEIAPVQGQARGLDWSGVLTVICRAS